ncbi:MAG: NAD-dependent epimerase/dehydratase family protein [Deltaproteobacteria bacterium]|nr:NAD-dependent epimerase/dehydratase family protein [Deltaproteobacteria bacterium]
MNERNVHVILGAGQIGSHLAKILASQGLPVRTVARRARALGEGITHLQGSITDPAIAERAGADAAVVYQCANPPYPAWDRELPAITEGALRAAKTQGARLVVLDNLYAFGRMNGAPMKPEGPFAPCSRKGALRLRLQERLLRAHTDGEARVAIAKASDFVGPGVVEAHLGARFFERVFAGKSGECFGDPALPHALTYAPDLAKALATLGAHPEADGRVWHVPTLEARSPRAWADALGRALGREITISTVPRWVTRGVGIFVPMLGELHEMRYQWEEPYLVDDQDFRTTFAIEPTPFEAQVEATARWAQETYAGKP